jgi:hypothetical protein
VLPVVLGVTTVELMLLEDSGQSTLQCVAVSLYRLRGVSWHWISNAQLLLEMWARKIHN